MDPKVFWEGTANPPNHKPNTSWEGTAGSIEIDRWDSHCHIPTIWAVFKIPGGWWLVGGFYTILHILGISIIQYRNPNINQPGFNGIRIRKGFWTLTILSPHRDQIDFPELLAKLKEPGRWWRVHFFPWYNVGPPFTLAKLLQISIITMVYDTQITVVNGICKSTYS